VRIVNYPRTLLSLICAMVCATMPTPATAASFSYDDWNSVLQTFVDEEGLVDYDGLAADRDLFDRFLSLIETTSPETDPDLFPTREDQLAYYINAYNAHVFNGVLNLSPDAGTVWGITRSGNSFFSRTKIMVGGRQSNLQDLENEIIREGFKDPRIHAALNCASVGCPKLPSRAFEPATLDDQLDAEMTKFVGEVRNCKIDLDAGTVTLSKIFDWFRGDFEGYESAHDGGGLLDYINRYRAADAQIPDGLKIEFSKYDKRLNRQ